LLPGGFVGVDIFFVISGYLITRILLEDFDRGQFSIARFYARRCRRILPALFCVLTACFVAGMIVYPPSTLIRLAHAATFSLMFCANIFFFLKSGYFAPNAHLEPLLHTWSLAVEEQFYLLFPLLLFSMNSRLGRRKMLVVLVVLAVASFAAMEWMLRVKPSAAFFLAPFRAWELLAGSICAFAAPRLVAERSVGNGLSVLGLALILAGFAFIDGDMPFPSWPALAPVVGSSLVILFARDGTIAKRLLENRLFVGIGLISYSLYLWHQPILAFARYLVVRPLSPIESLALIALAVMLSVASWRWVEMPWRRTSQSAAHGTGQARTMLLRAVGAFAGILLIISATSGMRTRFDERRLLAFEETSRRAAETDLCKQPYEGTEPLDCSIFTDTPNAPRIAVIGDSHASQLYPVLLEVAQRREWNIDIVAKSSCPIVDMPIGIGTEHRAYPECKIWREALWAKLNAADYDLIVVAHSTLSYISYNGRYNIPVRDWTAAFDKAGARLQALAPAWAILIDNPQFREIDPINCGARVMLFDFDAADYCKLPRSKVFALDANLAESMVAHKHGGEVLDFTSAYCNGDLCSPFHQGGLVMSDLNHLSQAGAKRIATPLEDGLARAMVFRQLPESGAILASRTEPKKFP
jgi:peptidoglycan/LPS O-acetylase OafA/YrhL